jgi:hypothetical protein
MDAHWRPLRDAQECQDRLGKEGAKAARNQSAS